MGDPTVLELIVDKIDALDEKVTQGFGRINGTLGEHQLAIGSIQMRGCARYGGECGNGSSRSKRAMKGTGLVAAGGFIGELLRRVVEAWR